MAHRTGKCVSQHRVLFIEQWTPLGAFVTCVCGQGFFADTNLLEGHYLAFQHVSPRGPEFDRGIFVYAKEVDGDSY